MISLKRLFLKMCYFGAFKDQMPSEFTCLNGSTERRETSVGQSRVMTGFGSTNFCVSLL